MIAKPKRSIGEALTGALEARGVERRAVRHLHIVEQTLTMRKGELTDVPLVVLQKALLELHVVLAGAERDRSLLSVKQRIEDQIFRKDLRDFLVSSRSSITWENSDQVDIHRGEFVDTARMLIDVPIGWESTIHAGLKSAARGPRHG